MPLASACEVQEDTWTDGLAELRLGLPEVRPRGFKPASGSFSLEAIFGGIILLRDLGVSNC